MTDNYHLFVIGIDQYDIPQFPPLKTAVSDAQKLITILEDKYSFQKKSYLLDKHATKENIIDSFVELSNFIHEDDSLVFFFSGHGWEDPNNKKGYLVPIDGDHRSKLISYTEIINDYLEVLPAKHILIIFDCCYAANFISRTKGNYNNSSSHMKRYSLPSRYFLGAGGEEPVLDGSPFMPYLISYLTNNTDKFFAVTDLAASIKENVGNVAKQQPICEPMQHLNKHTVGGEFIFTLKDEYLYQGDIDSANFKSENILEIKDEFARFLEDTGTVYLHSKVDEVLLSDIFVEPNLKTIDIDKVNKITGFDITLVTTAKTNEEAYELLREMGMPFKNMRKENV